MKTFFLLDFYEDNVITNLADTVPWNDIFIVVTEETAEFTGTRDDQGIDAPCGTVKFQIDGTAEAFAGAGIYDFFLFQFTKTHKYTFFRNCSVPSQLRFFPKYMQKICEICAVFY